MTTAAAVTDGNGSIHSITCNLGSPISAAQLYSNKDTNTIRGWRLIEETDLNKLRYSLKMSLGPAAKYLIDKRNYDHYEPVTLYKEHNKRVYAIHCIKRGKVTYTDMKFSFVEVSDHVFNKEIKAEK